MTSVQAGKFPTPEGGTPSDTLVVRVRMSLVWTGQVVKDGVKPTTIDYDVLVLRGSTAAPVVVGWDGAGTGTGSELTQFGNAVAADIPVNTSVPVVTSTPAATPSIPGAVPGSAAATSGAATSGAATSGVATSGAVTSAPSAN